MMLDFINNWKPTVRVGDVSFYTVHLINLRISKYDVWWVISFAVLGFEVQLCIPRKAEA